MKYIRTYETEEKFLTDKDSTSRGFRLKPTLYKYDSNGDHIHLEIDDPRKHEGSTYMEITLDADVEFSFYIGNKSGDTQTTMTCTIDWGDGTVETKTITKDDKGFKLAHSYVAGSYKIELYNMERGYRVVGDVKNWKCLISHSSSVKRVVLGNSVGSTGDYTFRNCSSLTSVHIPEGATSIGYNAFRNCSSLTSIHIPESVTRIWDSAFKSCTSLTSINIPESVNSIGENAFYTCTSLKSIYIPESVTSIGAGAFNQCSSLTSINIPKRVTSIGSGTFFQCSSLTSINIPKRVTSIRSGIFYRCSSLTSINIPESVTSIGAQAFEWCSALISISSLNTTAPTLGSYNVFTNLPADGTLHIKPGATGYDAWLSKLPSGWTIVEDL